MSRAVAPSTNHNSTSTDVGLQPPYSTPRTAAVAAAAVPSEKVLHEKNSHVDVPIDSSASLSPSLNGVRSNQSNTSLVIPGRHAVPARSHSPDLDTLSLISADDFSELRRSEHLPRLPRQDPLQRIRLDHDDDNDDDGEAAEVENKENNEEKIVGKSFSARVAASWKRNKGVFLVLLAQLFGVTMNITTRLLEREEGEHGMHPFQILFARMSITFLLSTLYMWYTKTPDFPFGAKGVRILLICRGLGGFWGVYGLYWALQYLPLSDATVLSFIAPLAASFACSKILREPFTRIEQIGGIISLVGVVLVARPTYIFTALLQSSSSSSSSSSGATESPDVVDARLSVRAMQEIPEATPQERLVAVGMSMAGVAGATIAYTTIRWIGRRAHPLISVNYFAATCTVVSFTALTFVPSIPFVLPSTLKEWTLLFFIGVSGFIMQFLLTAGLRYEKSSRATNMAYSQMLFAIAGDKIVWGVTPGVWSVAGGTLILGSAICIAVQKESVVAKPAGRVEASSAAGQSSNDEEMGLVEAHRLESTEEEQQQQHANGALEMVRMK